MLPACNTLPHLRLNILVVCTASLQVEHEYPNGAVGYNTEIDRSFLKDLGLGPQPQELVAGTPAPVFDQQAVEQVEHELAVLLRN